MSQAKEPEMRVVKATRAMLLPTSIVLMKSAGWSNQPARIRLARVPRFFFNSTRSLFADTYAISDPLKRADKTRARIIRAVSKLVR
mgnify:CR=1 FL=1